ncbi:S1 domain-containing protein [Megalodesulfovibrio paquesii]
MIDDAVIQSFELMWGLFPESVMLVHKNRTILAVNRQGRELGVATGIKCSSLNPENLHDANCTHCRAAASLREGQAKWIFGEFHGRKIRGFWVPLDGVPDVYLHFSVGTESEAAASV